MTHPTVENVMEKIAVSVGEAAKLASLSRSRLYELFKSGAITPRKQDGRTLVLVSDLRTYLENLPAAKIGGR